VTFHFPVGKTARGVPTPGTWRAPKAKKAPAQVEERGLIQGKMAMSIEEWRVAVALWKYKVEFVYQVGIGGGYSRRGGQVVDFLVFNPFPEPWQVFGEYWHESELNSEERFKLEILARIWNRKVVILFAKRDLPSQEQADASVRDKLRGG